MHLQICRINAYSAAVARVSTRTHYSLTSSLSPRTDEPPPPLPPRVSTLYTLAARSRSPRIRADVGRRARASRLRNHVSEENLAAGYFLKIRDFKIRVGKQPPLSSPDSGEPSHPSRPDPLSYSRFYLDTVLSLPPRGVLRPNLRPLVTVSSLLACTHAPDGANG